MSLTQELSRFGVPTQTRKESHGSGPDSLASLSQRRLNAAPVGRHKCVVCGNADYDAPQGEIGTVRGNTQRFLGVRFRLFKCARCQSICALDDVDLADSYREYALNKRRLDFFARGTLRNLLKRLVSGGLKRTDRILDFGCGNGIFLQYLHQRGYRNAEGYDPFVPQFADGSRSPRSYDCVVANDVIEHSDDPRAVLRECARLVKPAGLLYVGTADSEGVQDMANLEPHLMRLHQPFHRVIISQRSLLALGEELGLARLIAFRRSYMDTMIPFCSYRFLDELNKALGHDLDVALSPDAGRIILRQPALLIHAFFGYFFPSAYEPAVLWRKPA
jgi:SAM-dependent methyltransferase